MEFHDLLNCLREDDVQVLRTSLNTKRAIRRQAGADDDAPSMRYSLLRVLTAGHNALIENSSGNYELHPYFAEAIVKMDAEKTK